MDQISFSEFKKNLSNLDKLNTFSDYVGGNKLPVSFYRGSEREERVFNHRGWYGYVSATSGITGGSCYGGDNYHTFSRPTETPDSFLEEILETYYSDISFLKFAKIKRELPTHEFSITEREYYGNSTTYSGIYYDIFEVYQSLIAAEIIAEYDKEAILIGGLPCSGKTTAAVELYSDYYLIDDPKNWDVVKKKLKKNNKIVIADPHLSFLEDRNLAIEQLRDNGFHVEVVLLDVPKTTLRKRAKDLNKTDRIEFIKNFKLEK